MADPICKLKQLQQTGDIKQYYEAFDEIRRCIQWPEEFLIRWFIAGLKWDTRKELQSIQPQTLVQAYAYGRMYEIAYPKGRPIQSKPTQKCSSPTSLVSISIPTMQEDGDHDLQLESQTSDRKFQERLQELDRSKMLDSIDLEATNSIELEEESEKEFARHVFDESPRYDMMKRDDVFLNGVMKNGDDMIINEDHVQIKGKFEQILIGEPSDMNALQVFDEMPISSSSQETQQLGQFPKIISDGLEFQIISGSSFAKYDDLKAFEEPKLQPSISTVEEQQSFRVHLGLTEQVKSINGFVRIVGFDPGGGAMALADSVEQEPIVGSHYNGSKLVPIIGDFNYPVVDGEPFVTPFDRGKSVFELDGSVSGLEDRAMQEHDMVERLSFGSRSQSTFVFNPGGCIDRLEFTGSSQLVSTLELILGTGDHSFERRLRMGFPLLKENVATMVLESPFYGRRRPSLQRGAKLLCVSDLLLLGRVTIEEARSLLWLDSEAGFGKLGVCGLSMGGVHAAMVGSLYPTPVATLPFLSPHSAVVAFCEGVLKYGTAWEALRDDLTAEKTVMTLEEVQERMRNVLSLTDVTRFPISKNHNAIIFVAATDDGYIPNHSVLEL